MHDLVIRNATIVDGTGRPRFAGDIAVDGGTIVAVGTVDDGGRREINAAGDLVTPGWVDIHTHYDGQATWDSLMAPSSWHGVTSIVMGNCGVGFAPVAPDKHDFLIALMEGVEDIPETALAEGLQWNWESLPEYFDAVDARPHTIDLGAQVPHSALRSYVMGDRGADHEEDPTPDEIQKMALLTKEALLAGALGFATSRTAGHRSRSGENIGTLTATAEELIGIGQALRETGLGVFQLVSDAILRGEYPPEEDIDVILLRRLAKECGRPLSVTMSQSHAAPTRWRDILNFMERCAASGVDIKGQVSARPTAALIGLESTVNPYMYSAAYQLIAGLPLAERVEQMRRPELRARILADWRNTDLKQQMGPRVVGTHNMFVLGDPPNYEPDPSQSLKAEAQRRGIDDGELLYDTVLQDAGRTLLYCPLGNYANYTLDPAREMILSDRTLFGLSDAGAHCGFICDASFPTFNVMHWCRDRQRGEQLPLEFVIKGQTKDTASHVGWRDRGVLAPGYKADINVIDFDRLQLRQPEMHYDLPAGGKRLLQRAEGYRFTIQSGVVTFEDGIHTGELPGRLVRGPQAMPH